MALETHWRAVDTRRLRRGALATVSDRVSQIMTARPGRMFVNSHVEVSC